MKSRHLQKNIKQLTVMVGAAEMKTIKGRPWKKAAEIDLLVLAHWILYLFCTLFSNYCSQFYCFALVRMYSTVVRQVYNL